MGLFDKMKKKKEETTTPSPEAVVEENVTVAEQPAAVQEDVQQVQDNVFNADGVATTEPQVAEVQLTEMQIQNVDEPTAEQTAVATETAAVVDNPEAIPEQQVALQVNPEEVFEGGEIGRAHV